MAAGAAVTIAGSLVPWLRTGDRNRNSFDLFRVVGRLGFAPDGPAAAAIRWWPLVPLLAVVAVVIAWWGWARAGGALGAVAALYAGGVAVAVATSPAAGALDVAPGPLVTAAGAIVLLVGSLAAAVVGVGSPVATAGVRSSTDRGGSARP